MVLNLRCMFGICLEFIWMRSLCTARSLCWIYRMDLGQVLNAILTIRLLYTLTQYTPTDDTCCPRFSISEPVCNVRELRTLPVGHQGHGNIRSTNNRLIWSFPVRHGPHWAAASLLHGIRWLCFQWCRSCLANLFVKKGIVKDSIWTAWKSNWILVTWNTSSEFASLIVELEMHLYQIHTCVPTTWI